MTNNGMHQSKIAVILADANSLTRDCFALSFGTLCKDMDVHTVPSLKEAALAINQTDANEVVLYNIGAAHVVNDVLATGIQEAVEACHPAPLIIISDHDDIDMILECLRLGVRGYIVANLGLGVTLEAIRLVAAGGTFIPATSLHKLTHPSSYQPTLPSGAPASRDSINGLTPREMAVLNCLREGKSNKIIAYTLGMCENTAKAHVRNVLKKLGATNRTEAAYLAHTQLHGGMALAKQH